MATTMVRDNPAQRPERSLLWPEASIIDRGECGENCTFEVRPHTTHEDTIAILINGQISAVEDCRCGLSTNQHQGIAYDMLAELPFM